MIWQPLLQLAIYTGLIVGLSIVQQQAIRQSPFGSVALFIFLWTIAYWPSVVAVTLMRWARRISPSAMLKVMVINEAILLLLAQIGLFMRSDWPFYIAIVVEIAAIHWVLAFVRKP